MQKMVRLFNVEINKPVMMLQYDWQIPALAPRTSFAVMSTLRNVCGHQLPGPLQLLYTRCYRHTLTARCADMVRVGFAMASLASTRAIVAAAGGATCGH